MKNVFRGQIVSGELRFGSSYNEGRFRDWVKKNEKKRFILTIDEPTGTQLRRFFEGAVVPYYAYQQPVFDKKAGKWRLFTLPEARENIKLGYNPKYLLRPNGDHEVVAGSTDYNKEDFQKFLERIERGFMENGFSFPDSVDYKKWRDSAPLIGEVYPPLQRLIDLSVEELKKLNANL